MTDEETANCLNYYFTSVSHIEHQDTTLPHLDSKTQNTLDNVVISKLDSKDFIGILDVNKVVGLDFTQSH